MAALKTSLVACGFLLVACQPRPEPATAPPAKAEAKTATIRGEEVHYEAGGAKMTGFLAWDEGETGTRPGVLVVHEWWGHNDYARRRARMLAAEGYVALAVDMYGDGKKAAHPDDAKKFAMEVFQNRQQAGERFEAAKALLAAHPSADPQKTAAIGYCFGGGVVLHAARAGSDLDAVASFHGSLATETPAQAGAVKSRVFVFHGEADPFVPVEEVAGFKEEMKAAGVRLDFFAYPGVVHSFTNPEATEMGKKFNMPLGYDQAADEASWATLLKGLREVFAG